MENRNNCGTPRDMIDSELLERILGDGVRHGRYGSSEDYSRTRENNSSEGSSSCGCKDRSSNSRYERRRCGSNDTRSDERREGCGCGESRRKDRREEYRCSEFLRENRRMEGFPIAMAYVPEQEWKGIYEADEALNNGTLFNELNLPFNHSSCGGNCGCR